MTGVRAHVNQTNIPATPSNRMSPAATNNQKRLRAATRSCCRGGGTKIRGRRSRSWDFMDRAPVGTARQSKELEVPASPQLNRSVP